MQHSKNPEGFFSSGQYEHIGAFEELLVKLGAVAFEAVREKNFDGALDIGRQALLCAGVEAARHAGTQSPNDAIALTEAINWASKTVSYGFYSLKPAMIVAASQTEGVFFGFGEDNAYYLGSPTIGTASFHDPGDEVGYLLVEVLKQDIPIWEYEWSGVPRQEDAFHILEDLASGRQLTETYANLTSPEEISTARRKYMEERFRARLITIGDLLAHKTEEKART